MEPALLTLASLIKHKDFKEEKEWRVVLPAQELSKNFKLEIWGRKKLLVPFIELALPIWDDGRLIVDQITLGPTADEDVAFRALRSFMARKTKCGGVYRTRSPYRQ